MACQLRKKANGAVGGMRGMPHLRLHFLPKIRVVAIIRNLTAYLEAPPCPNFSPNPVLMDLFAHADVECDGGTRDAFPIAPQIFVPSAQSLLICPPVFRPRLLAM